MHGAVLEFTDQDQDEPEDIGALLHTNRCGDIYIEAAPVSAYADPFVDEVIPHFNPVPLRQHDWVEEFSSRQRYAAEDLARIEAIAALNRAVAEDARRVEWETATEAVLAHCRYALIKVIYPDTSTVLVQYDLDSNRGARAWRKDTATFDWQMVSCSMLGAATAAECWV